MIGPDTPAEQLVVALAGDEFVPAMTEILARWNRAQAAHNRAGVPWAVSGDPIALGDLQRECQPAVDVLGEFSRLWLLHCYDRARITFGEQLSRAEYVAGAARLGEVLQRDGDACDFGGHKGRGRLGYWAALRLRNDFYGLHRQLSGDAGQLRTEIFGEIVNLVLSHCLTPKFQPARSIVFTEQESPA